MSADETKALLSRIDRLEREAALRNGHTKPPPYVAPTDYSARLSMPASAVAAIVGGTPAGLAGDLAGDARRTPIKDGVGYAKLHAETKPTGTPVAHGRGTGWIDTDTGLAANRKELRKKA